MPSNWLEIDTRIPTFTGRESPREQIEKLRSYLYTLSEQLRYQLRNLDATNWNKGYLTEFQEETTADIKKQLEETDKRVKINSGKLAELDTALKEAQRQIDELSGDISSIRGSISDVEARIEQLDSELSSRIGAAEAATAALTTRMEAAEAAIKELQGK